VVLPAAEVRRLERENILAALRQSDGRIRGPGGAAELLGLKPTTLAGRIKTLGVRKPNA
jgi:transcriptional regulator with GAF, ATPase, and Fis domain